MNSEFLSTDEVVQLTEYSAPKRQRDQLKGMGVKFAVTRSGKPIVSREAIRQLLGFKSKGRTVAQSFEPNLED